MADDSHEHQHRTDTPAHPRGDEHQPRTGDLNVPLIVTIGLVSCILLIVIGLGTVAWYRHELRLEQWTKVIERENPALRELNLEAEARLRTIDQAIGSVADRYQQASPEQRAAMREPVPMDELDVAGVEETDGEPTGEGETDDDAPEAETEADETDAGEPEDGAEAETEAEAEEAEAEAEQE